MKAKYKLGQLLQSADSFGKVEAVISKTDSTEYQLAEGGTVAEGDVTAVYRPVAPRKPRDPNAPPRTRKSGGKKRANGQTHASA